MLPAGEITESVLNQLLNLLSPNDIVIEGGNSNFKDSIDVQRILRRKKYLILIVEHQVELLEHLVVHVR